MCDLTRLRDEILSGKPLDELSESYAGVYRKYKKSLHRLEDIYLRSAPVRTEMTTCDWYYNVAPGAEQSHPCFAEFTPKTHYMWKYGSGPGCVQTGYTGQPVVVMRQFKKIDYGFLLGLIDRWPMSVRWKRGREYRWFISKHIIVFSYRHPEKIYVEETKQDGIAQLHRRIKLIKM
jgi:hypothetical protein